MTQNRYYSNIANVTILTNAGGINAIITNLQVQATTGFPVQFPFILRIEPATANEELVLVNSGSGTSGAPYTVTRGYDGTSAKSHAAGVIVKHGFSQLDFSEPQQHLTLTGSSSAAHGLPANAWSGGTQQLIQALTLGSTSAITFSSIPATFNHLQLRVVGRSANSGGAPDEAYIQFNGDTGTNYYSRQISGNQTTPGPSFVSLSASATPKIGSFIAGSAEGQFVCNINGYAGTTFRKMWNSEAITQTAVASPNNFEYGTFAGTWTNAAAISSIVIQTGSVSGFSSGTQAWLYGIL